VNPIDQLRHFPAYVADGFDWRVQYRQAGNTARTPTHVLLHGIGSGSASWLHQLHTASASAGHRVVAWDAPGYGTSSPLLQESPSTDDYATRLWQWLDTLGATEAITLVGHSLGCLVAARAALLAPQRVAQLVLLAPAQGYARAGAAERQKKLQDRLDALANLGPAGLAQKRGSAMLSPRASAEQIGFVQSVMAQLNPAGYAQAARLLAHSDLLTDLAQLTCPIQVASGSADSITPSTGCRVVAEAARAPYTDLGSVGHVCAFEAPDAVSQLLGLPHATVNEATP
jgi:pimeloyl-ACP methyl ester carboxylesterase